MEVSATEFIERLGLDASFTPGQIKYHKVVGDKPGTSYTLVYDWKTDPYKIRVEMRPGLTGELPNKKELSQYAVWLQTVNYVELDLSHHKKTKH